MAQGKQRLSSASTSIEFANPKPEISETKTGRIQIPHRLWVPQKPHQTDTQALVTAERKCIPQITPKCFNIISPGVVFPFFVNYIVSWPLACFKAIEAAKPVKPPVATTTVPGKKGWKKERNEYPQLTSTDNQIHHVEENPSQQPCKFSNRNSACTGKHSLGNFCSNVTIDSLKQPQVAKRRQCFHRKSGGFNIIIIRIWGRFHEVYEVASNV